MVLIYQLQEPVKQFPALLLAETINVLDMPSDREYTLPAGDRVGTDDGMDSFELWTNILRRTPFFGVELEVAALSDVFEPRLRECCCQSLKELLVRLADTVVDLVARGPEGI